MKKFLAATAFLMTPVLSSASTMTGAQLVEAKAVLASSEIAALLNVEKKTRHLACEKVSLDDVIIKADATMDSFEVVYGCNDAKGGANVQRIHFSGGVYTSSPTSTTAEVILTDMTIELSE